ncbi:glycosyltransferase family 2 protein [Clostridium neonatale]|uniref:glycosyltransferase family 2 protein n=1 Tax=Clostridium neonatale TaxID=137838 RepID=UPI003D3565E6
MEENYLVTIIIPVYQSEKWLDKCLESILKQSYQYFEVVLVDDGSTDSSGFICDTYKKIDSRFKVIHQDNKGASVARNLGITMASGKYIYFVDSDDWLYEECIKELIEGISDKNDIVISNYYLVDKNKCHSNFNDTGEIELISRQDIVLSLLKLSKKENHCEGYLWNKLFLREIIVENNIIFDSRFVMWEDMLFCYKYMIYVRHGVYVHKNLYYHRKNEESLSYFLNVDKANSWYNASRVLYKSIEKYDNNIIASYNGVLANICVQNLIINSFDNKLKNCDEYNEKIKFICRGKEGLRLKYKIYYFSLCFSKKIFYILVKILKF